MATMKAIRIHAYGGPEVLKYEDAPRPTLNDDDVLIKVVAAGVNPVDWKIRQGYMKDLFPLPFVLGWDVAGVIEEKGKDVTNLEVGESVYARPSIFRDGAYAEYIAVKAIKFSKGNLWHLLVLFSLTISGFISSKKVFKNGFILKSSSR